MHQAADASRDLFELRCVFHEPAQQGIARNGGSEILPGIRELITELVKEFHPDAIVSKGLPEEFTEFATKRFREIQEAYETIRNEREFR